MTVYAGVYALSCCYKSGRLDIRIGELVYLIERMSIKMTCAQMGATLSPRPHGSTCELRTGTLITRSESQTLRTV